MRVINDNNVGREAAPPKTVEGQGQKPELESTCTRCLSQFAFRPTDPEVVTTNELEYLLDCPVCEAPLEIHKNTGIVRQRNPEN